MADVSLPFQYSVRSSNLAHPADRRVRLDQERRDRELEDYLARLSTASGTERWDHGKWNGFLGVTSPMVIGAPSITGLSPVEQTSQGVTPVSYADPFGAVMFWGEKAVYLFTLEIELSALTGADAGVDSLWIATTLAPSANPSDDLAARSVTQIPVTESGGVLTPTAPVVAASTVSLVIGSGPPASVHASYEILTGPTMATSPLHNAFVTVSATWQCPSTREGGGG